jgi:hypothetical protein
MNKKLIIGLIFGGALIAGGLYWYNRNKKANEFKKNFPAESEALEIAKLVGEINIPYNSEQKKIFVELYISKIDKESNKKIKTALNKNESDWTAEDKQAYADLTEYVLKFVPKK